MPGVIGFKRFIYFYVDDDNNDNGDDIFNDDDGDPSNFLLVNHVNIKVLLWYGIGAVLIFCHTHQILVDPIVEPKIIFF